MAHQVKVLAMIPRTHTEMEGGTDFTKLSSGSTHASQHSRTQEHLELCGFTASPDYRTARATQ